MTKKIRHLFFAVSAIAVMLAVAGCGAKKNAVTDNSRHETAAQRSIDQLISAQPVFDNARSDNSKVSVEFNKHKVSANAEINIDRNKVIKVNVKVFGIVMAMAEITPEHIVLVDKMNKRYTEMTFAQIQQLYGIAVSYNDVEALLTNRLFAIGTPDNKIKKLNPRITMQGDNQQVSFLSSDINHHFTFSTDNNRIIKTELITASGNSNIIVNYKDFRTFDKVLFPATMVISIKNKKNSGKASFTLTPLHFNEGAFTSPIDTRKLTKVDLKTIIPGF